MATPGGYHNPASEAADLKTLDDKTAYEEGHDADVLHHVDIRTQHDKKEMSGAPIVDENDANEVWWSQPENEDPHNPMNWSSSKKWSHVAILSIITLITPLASSMFAPGVPAVMKEFRTNSDTLATFVVSVYLLGFAFGPLLLAPISEIYGRYWIYTICNFLFIVFAVACAVSKNMAQLIAFRFLHGVVGVSPLTLGGGTIADIMPVERRAAAMTAWAMGPLVGPIVGPVAGGYLVERQGWRWTFWLLAILSAAASIACLILTRETYAPVLLERKAAKLRRETGNIDLHSRLASNIPQKEIFRLAITRPTKMLLLSPIVSVVCVYTAVAYGILYMLFTTFTFVFTEIYDFNTGTIGLTFIPLGLGMIFALGIMGTVSDRIIRGKQDRGARVLPEDRIPIRIVLPAALLLPVGLFIYGWTAKFKTHWIAPMIGTAICGFALLIIFMALQTYLVDAFVRYAASSMAANTVLRSLVGGLLPLSGLRLLNALGLGWANTLLALIALVLVPIPVLFSIYGERIRNHPRSQIKL